MMLRLTVLLGLALEGPALAQSRPPRNQDEAYRAVVWFEVTSNCGHEGAKAQGVFVAGDRLLTVLHALSPAPCKHGQRIIALDIHGDGPTVRGVRATAVALDPFRDLVELKLEGYVSPFYLERQVASAPGRVSWVHYDRVNEALSGEGAHFSKLPSATARYDVPPGQSGFDTLTTGVPRTSAVPIRKELPGCVKHDSSFPSPTMFVFKDQRAVSGHSGSVVWDDELRLHSLVVAQVIDARSFAAVDAYTPLPVTAADAAGLKKINCTLDTTFGSYNAAFVHATTDDMSGPAPLPWRSDVCLPAEALHAEVEAALLDAWETGFTPYVLGGEGFVEAEPVAISDGKDAAPPPNATEELPCKPELARWQEAVDATADLLRHLATVHTVWSSVLAAVAAPPVCLRGEGPCDTTHGLDAFTCSGAWPDAAAAAAWDSQWRRIDWGPIAEDGARRMCEASLGGCEQISCDLPRRTPRVLAKIRFPDYAAEIDTLYDLLETSCGYTGWVSPFDQVAIQQTCERPEVMVLPTADPSPLCLVAPALAALGVAGAAPLDCADPSTVSALWSQLMPDPPPDETWADLGTSALRLAQLEQRVVAHDLVDPVLAVSRFIHVPADDFARYGDLLQSAPWSRFYAAISALPEPEHSPANMRALKASLQQLDQLLHGAGAIPRYDDAPASDLPGRDRLRGLITEMLAHHVEASLVFDAPDCENDDCRRIAWARHAYTRLDTTDAEVTAFAERLHQLLYDWAH